MLSHHSLSLLSWTTGRMLCLGCICSAGTGEIIELTRNIWKFGILEIPFYIKSLPGFYCLEWLFRTGLDFLLLLRSTTLDRKPLGLRVWIDPNISFLRIWPSVEEDTSFLSSCPKVPRLWVSVNSCFYQIIATLGTSSYQCGIVVILGMSVILFLPLKDPPWGNMNWLRAPVRGQSQQDWELALHTPHPAHPHLSHPIQITGRHGKTHQGWYRTSRAYVYIQGNPEGTSTIWKWVSIVLFHLNSLWRAGDDCRVSAPRECADIE